MNDTRKYVGSLDVGDYVIAYSRFGKHATLAKVIRTTKTQLVAQTEPMSDDEPGFVSTEIRITRRSGKKVGSDKYFSHCPDVEAAKQAQAELRTEKKAQEDARQARIKARWEAAKAANPELVIQDVINNIKMTTFKDVQDRELVLFFVIKTREDDVFFPFGEDKMQYRVEAATYGPWSLGEVDWTRHSPEYGETVEAALLELITRTFPY